MDGQPVQIISQNEETKAFELDEDALAGILLSPEVADKHVCLLAVAGAFRMGKSFLLDFFIRYCVNQVGPGMEDWLEDTARPLQGFQWRQGFRRETTGIFIWNKPFIMKNGNDEQVAVILMDTQGTFDTESSMKDSTIIFALTLMGSSVLVYNVMNNIREDDLMNLQTFTSYGVQAQEELNISAPFQKLLFLVRDWGFSSEVPYGKEGGQRVLDGILEIKAGLHPSHKNVRRDIRKCFKELGCYLMPHPGLKALENETFDGRVADLEEKFVHHLRLLVPQLLAPKNLVKKEQGGQLVTAAELYNFFKTFVELFRNTNLPEPTTFTEVATRLCSQRALEIGRNTYSMSMDDVVLKQSETDIAKLKEKHEEAKKLAICTFMEENQYRRANQRVVAEFQSKLVDTIDKQLALYERISKNEEERARHVAAAARRNIITFNCNFY